MHFVLRLHVSAIMRFLLLPYISSAFWLPVMNYGEEKRLAGHGRNVSGIMFHLVPVKVPLRAPEVSV